MLAGIHGQRGERAAAAAAQRRAIELLASQRPQIQPEELERFEAELSDQRAKLAEYEAPRK